MKDPDTDVLIVGAGPTGLSLGCDLARRGVSCRIVDASPTPFAGSRGKGLQPRTLEVFDDLGIIDEVFASGGPFLPFRAYAGREVIWERTFFDMLKVAAPQFDPTIPFPAPLVIPQWRTDQILTKRFEALGGRIDRGVRFTDLSQDDDHVRATLVATNDASAGQRVHARYLIGCDGGKSAVRKALGVSFLGETFESERTLIGDVHVDGLGRDVCHMLTVGGDIGTRVSLWPLPGTRAFQFIATLATDEVPELSLAALQQMVDERWEEGSGIDDRPPIRLHDLTWLSVYRVNVRMVDRYRVGRVFLAGDAAHVHSSAGGQGLNTSVQDAYNLGWKIAAVLNGAASSLLDSYEQERMPIAADVLGVTTRWHQRQFRDLPAEKSAGATSVPPLYQLGLNYRGGPLSVDARAWSGSVRAGDRAPDSPVTIDDAGAVDSPRTLFDVFRGPHWSLLIFGDCGPEVDAAIEGLRFLELRIVSINGARRGGAKRRFRVIDTIEAIGDTYDLRRPSNGSALVLIRPDGYIGFIADQSSVDLAASLRAYETAVLGD